MVGTPGRRQHSTVQGPVGPYNHFLSYMFILSE